MKVVRIIGISALLFAGMQSCKKDNSSAPCTISKTGLAGKYKLTALEYKLNATTPAMDYMASMDACEKDDIIELKADGSWLYTDAGTVCSPSGTDNGTWSLTGNTITSDGVVSGTIDSYNCSKLVCITRNVIVTGDMFTQTLQKQ